MGFQFTQRKFIIILEESTDLRLIQVPDIGDLFGACDGLESKYFGIEADIA